MYDCAAEALEGRGRLPFMSGWYLDPVAVRFIMQSRLAA